MADPPWRFKPYSRTTGLDRSPDNHYPTEDREAIASWDVCHKVAFDDCVLALWATVPQLEDAMVVMTRWGFTYKSHVSWEKQDADGEPVEGTGYWFRNSHELLLFGTRGKPPAPAPGEQWGSIIKAERGEHSEKPDAAYGLIEAYFPTLPKLEMNARRARLGWDTWGLEAPTPAPTLDGEPIPQFLRRFGVPLVMERE
jgi:N6-adenosine-specific RNA methylase IME4